MQVLDQIDSIAPVHAMATGLACSAQATAEEPTRGPEQVVAAVGEPATCMFRLTSCLSRVLVCVPAALSSKGLLSISWHKHLPVCNL